MVSDTISLTFSRSNEMRQLMPSDENDIPGLMAELQPQLRYDKLAASERPECGNYGISKSVVPCITMRARVSWLNGKARYAQQSKSPNMQVPAWGLNALDSQEATRVAPFDRVKGCKHDTQFKSVQSLKKSIVLRKPCHILEKIARNHGSIVVC